MINNIDSHQILLTIQYITISLLFIEIMIVFLRWKKSIHSYLFLACVASFISNLGYLFEMKATTPEEYFLALKFSYTGRVWIVFSLFLFTAKMCRIRIPKTISGILVLLNIIIYLTVLNVENTNLYYSDYQFIQDKSFLIF